MAEYIPEANHLDIFRDYTLLIIANISYRRLGIGLIFYMQVAFLPFSCIHFRCSEIWGSTLVKIRGGLISALGAAKLVMIIFCALFSLKDETNITLLVGRLGLFRSLVFHFFISIPMGLIIEQPDLGTGAFNIFDFSAHALPCTSKIKVYLIPLGYGFTLFSFCLELIEGIPKDRLMVLNPNIDPLGAVHDNTVKDSHWLRRVFGEGWLSRTQSQLRFLPEAHTDFIFASFSEEWGLLGGITLIILYFLLIRKGFAIAQRTNDQFGRLLAYGISILLGIQVVVNIAMTMGLAPIVGIPLPLMSYGGSSIFVTFIALGILVNIDKVGRCFDMYDDILLDIRRPGQYMGEWNVPKKDFNDDYIRLHYPFLTFMK